MRQTQEAEHDSGDELDITHQPQVFLLISSNGIALSRKQLSSGNMSVIVWFVSHRVQAKALLQVYAEAGRGCV